MGQGDGGQEGTGLPGLAAQLVGEDHRLIAQLLAALGGGGAQDAHTAGDDSLHVVQLFGGLLPQQLAHLVGEVQAIFLRHGQGLGAGGAVRVSGAGGDHVQGVPQDVGQDDGVYPGGGAQLGKAPPLHGGQPLADGVHLHDVRPAGQQLLGQPGQVLRRDQGPLEQGRAAAGHQKDHRVLRRQTGHQVDGRLGPPEGALVGDGVAPLPDGAVGDVPHAVAVLGHHHPGLEPVPQQVGGAAGHLPGRLARRHQIALSGAKVFLLQGPADGLVGQAGLKGLLDDGLCVLMDGHVAASL